MGELVPLSDHRSAWNQLNGMNLPEHNDMLSLPDAERINAGYDILIAGGVHGQGEGSSPLVRPTQREYEASARIVEGMKPADTLFIEQYGFDEPVINSPFGQLDKFKPIPQVGDILQDTMGHLLNVMAEAIKDMSPALIAKHRAQLEELRQDYKIDCWTYAAGLAYLKGIKVVHADKDAFSASADTNALGGPMLEMVTSEDTEKRSKAERVHSTREKALFNIVKDYALEHLPEVEAQQVDDSSTKPKLVVLWGRMHLPELDELFTEKGLNAAAFTMDSTPDMVSRIMEQTNHTLNQMINNLGAGVTSLATGGTERMGHLEYVPPIIIEGAVNIKKVTSVRLDDLDNFSKSA